MKKRLLSALLALVMVLALLPVSVFASAAGGSGTTTDGTKAEIKVTISLSTTPTWADGDTVTFSGDISATATYKVADQSGGNQSGSDQSSGGNDQEDQNSQPPTETDGQTDVENEDLTSVSFVQENAVKGAANGTWNVSVTAPQNYTGTFNGTTLTLTAPSVGATALSVSSVTATVTLADNSTAPTATIGTNGIVVNDGTDSSNGGGAPVSPNSPTWTLPTSTNLSASSSGASKLTNATYKTQDSAATSTVSAINGTPGWYASQKVGSITQWYRIDSGYIIGSTWYASWSELPATYSTITVVGGGSVTVPAKSTSLTVDVYPNGSAVSLNITGSTLTNLTVKDSAYSKEFRDRTGTKVSVSVSSAWAAGKTTTMTLTDVDYTGNISFGPDAFSHTVNLENCNVTGNISMSGRGITGSGTRITQVSKNQTLTIGKSTSSSRPSTVSGTIDIVGNGSRVQLTDVTCTMGMDLTGSGTMLTVDGSSNIGNITALEGDVITGTTAALTTINVNSGKVGNIGVSNTTLTGNINVNVAGQTGAINLGTAKGKPNINVTSGTTGVITATSGTINVSGTYANVGGLTLSGTASFKMTGTNHTVGDITASGTQVLIDVPAEPSNKLRIGSSGAGLNSYTGRNIKGGTWNYPVPKLALSNDLVYELNAGGNYTYYNYDQLNQALVSQYDSNGILCAVGESGQVNANQYYHLVFMNGKTVWGTMCVTGEMQIKLPTLVNTVTVTKWADGNHSSWNAGAMYPTPKLSDVTNNVNGYLTWELNASGGVTNGDVTKLTDVSAKGSWANSTYGDVKATLNGTVITLTGAVPSGNSNMTLTLTTDAIKANETTDASGNPITEDVPVTLTVGLTYFSGTKTLSFSNVANDTLGYGATLEFDENTNGVLRLSNGTKYTVNGSGLKEWANNITVESSASGGTDWFNHNFIEVSVNVSNIKTQADKQAVIDLLNGSLAKFDWSNSPAMREAVNAALATLTETQISGWIKTAKTNAWRKVNTGTPSDADLNSTGYDQAFLVPYLQVNVTAYNANGTLTATLVPSWRVEVRQTGVGSNDRYSTAFASTTDPNLPGNVYIAKAGAALSLGSNVSEIAVNSFDQLSSGITVKFASDTNALFSGLTPVFMHQDNTYAYARNGSGEFLIRHAGSSNGLGTVTINTTVPLVKLYDSNQIGANIIAYYDTLQAAVDDALDGQHIDVDQNYKGSMNVTVTGYARTFTIQANGQNVVLANASNGLVSLNSTGGEYTVQLTRDDSVVASTTTATISVTNVSNGTTSLSASSAKSGSKVTVTTTPVAGYRTTGVSVTAYNPTTKTNTAVPVTLTSTNVYSFTVPAGATSITVTPAFAVDTGMPFTDVGKTDPYYEAVKYVYDNGLMNGNNTTGTLFEGGKTLNRAMLVTILYRAAGSPAVSSINGFTDVASNQWYSQAVTWASQNGIVQGYGDNTFGPTDAITREQLVTILYRYNANYKGRATTGSISLAGYSDQGKVSNWATAGMQWAVGNGIVQGTTTTTLSPVGSSTRYQAAMMLMRYGKGFGL